MVRSWKTLFKFFNNGYLVYTTTYVNDLITHHIFFLIHLSFYINTETHKSLPHMHIINIDTLATPLSVVSTEVCSVD